MKVLVVSGFLGAGKTTFIKEMAEKTGLDLVVMENEYGEVGVDAGFLGDGQTMDIWELTEGCICCSMKADFASSVLTIANTLDPEFLIVEPTGVGVLSNVIHNLRQIQYHRITLLSPVTVLDAGTFDGLMRDYRELMEDQIRTAGTIVVSKRDFSGEEEAEALEKRLRAINGRAWIQIPHYSSLGKDWWERLLSTDLQGEQLPLRELDPLELDNLGLENLSFPDGNHLIAFLEQLIRGAYGSISRAKGYVRAGDAWLRFDVVGDRYSVTGFREAETPKSIFIGTDLKKGKLRMLL